MKNSFRTIFITFLFLSCTINSFAAGAGSDESIPMIIIVVGSILLIVLVWAYDKEKERKMKIRAILYKNANFTKKPQYVKSVFKPQTTSHPSVSPTTTKDDELPPGCIFFILAACVAAVIAGVMYNNEDDDDEEPITFEQLMESERSNGGSISFRGSRTVTLRSRYGGITYGYGTFYESRMTVSVDGVSYAVSKSNVSTWNYMISFSDGEAYYFD